MKNIILILSIIIISSTNAWSEKLYSDIYMQQYKITNTVIDTGIADGVAAKILADGKYRKIMRFKPIFFIETDITHESQKTLQTILDIIEQRGSNSYYISIIGHTSNHLEPSHEVKFNAWSRFWQKLGNMESISKEKSISLANNRIHTIYQTLMQNNISKSKIYTENRLSNDKIATEATPEGLAMNNRVDIALYIKGSETINLHIKFKLDSSIIRTNYTTKVKKFAKFMQRNRNYNALIIGHTDKQASYNYNIKLSKRRANATKRMLISLGVSANRLTTTGKGYTEPLDKRSTKSAYRKNRRIEAKLIQR